MAYSWTFTDAWAFYSFLVFVLLLLMGRLIETPDAGTIWPHQSQDGRCFSGRKERGNIADLVTLNCLLIKES